MPDWMTTIPFVAEGRWVMVILYLISMLGIALVFERLFALRQGKVIPADWSMQVREAVKQSGLQALGDQSVWPGYDSADVLRSVLRSAGAEAIEPAMIDQAALRKEEDLGSGLVLVGLFAAIAPLLGLLGTVAGMIETFRMISSGGIGDPQALAGGIYQALYTTAGGLVIAIPLTVAYRLLKNRCRQLADQIAAFVEELVWLDRRIQQKKTD